MGLGTRGRALGFARPPALRLGLRAEGRRSGEFRSGGLRHLGRALRFQRLRPRHPDCPRQREGQLLDDGRNRPLRSLFRAPRRSHPRRQSRHRPQPGQQRLRPLHRDLEPCLHPVQRRGRRLLPRAARQARRHRHGLRARLLDHPEHQGLHRLLDQAQQLRHRRLPADLPQARGAQRQDLREHLSRDGRRPLRLHGGNEGRDRLPRDRRPPAHPLVLDRRRHHARQQRPQLRLASDLAPRGPLRPPARLLRRPALLRRAGGNAGE